MPIYATVILDSGCFLKNPSQGPSTEIGYFGSSESVSDIRVIVDGKEVKKRLNLAKKGLVQVRHVKADGKTKQRCKVEAEKGFHDKILHLYDIYGEDMPVDRSKFDCILKFESGHFCAAMVKPRRFRKHSLQTNGKVAETPNEEFIDITKPIAHNVHVHFTLGKGEALELVRKGKVFWSSKDFDAKGRIDLEIIADNTTCEKFFADALIAQLDAYWMPNSGDPPPVCPEPPCYP